MVDDLLPMLRDIVEWHRDVPDHSRVGHVVTTTVGAPLSRRILGHARAAR
jgi:hypothetical protein